MNVIEAIETYQCPGCVCGSNTKCGKLTEVENRCASHVIGTIASGIGRIYLGLPKGFNRQGFNERTELYLYQKFEDWDGYDIFNVPVWKRLDKHGNTLVRMMMPRINQTWIQVFIGNHLDKINCVEITQKELDMMD